MAGKASLMLAAIALFVAGACAQNIAPAPFNLEHFREYPSAPAQAPFAASSLKPSDLQVALELRDALPAMKPYLIGDNPCAWNGIPGQLPPFLGCNSVNESHDEAVAQQAARITRIFLDGRQLPEVQANFPLQLLDQLDALTSIYITNTGYSSVLPAWTSLKGLTQLVLSNNSFTGTVPNSWSSGPSMKPALSEVNLASNHFEGTLPQWGKPLPISSLSLSNNRFNGTLPVSWMTLANVTSLDVHNNNITGELPVNWGLPDAFGHLFYVYLSNNSLSGALPDTWTAQSFRRPTASSNFGPSTVLITLDGNQQLGGPIPASFANTGMSLQVLPGTSLCGAVPEGVRAFEIMYGQGTKNATLPACPVNAATTGRKMLTTRI